MADRSSYVSSRTHTRIRFTPLKWTCALQCITPSSPVTQKSKLDLEVEVDRSLTECCIVPVLTVYDPDGVMDTSGGNKLLSALEYSSAYDYVRGHEWYVDGQEISSVWTEGTDYEIKRDTTSEYNGMLTVYKNLDPGDTVTLEYRGVFTDTRLAMNRVVTSDVIEMQCVEAGSEEVSMTVFPSVIAYDPLADQRLVYDYLTARGETAEYDDDGQTYERKATVTILQGTEPLESVPDGYALRWYLRGTDTEVTEDETYIDSIDGMDITFDMRCVEDTMLEARLENDDTGVVLCRCGVDLLYQPKTVRSVIQQNRGCIAVGQEEFSTDVIISTARSTVTYPELYYDIRWYTTGVGQSTVSETDDDSRVLRGYGESVTIDIDDIGMDTTTSDGGQFWTQVTVTERDVRCALTDSDGNALTDSDGNILIV